MKKLTFALVVSLIAVNLDCEAAIINGGFENGLNGWTTIGDVSIQTSSIGVTPTQGRNQALLTTLCNDGLTPAFCNGDGGELPYSGVSALPAEQVQQWLGFSSDPFEFFNQTKAFIGFPLRGEGSGIRTLIHAHGGSSIIFDWNGVSMGPEGDTAYWTLASADLGLNFFAAGTLFAGGFSPYQPSEMDLRSRSPDRISNCPRGTEDTCVPNVESGYRNGSISVPYDGWFYLGFGMGETAEGTVASAVLIDNLRIVPEPASLLLTFGPLFLVGLRAVHRN